MTVRKLQKPLRQVAAPPGLRPSRIRDNPRRSVTAREIRGEHPAQPAQLMRLWCLVFVPIVDPLP